MHDGRGRTKGSAQRMGRQAASKQSNQAEPEPVDGLPNAIQMLSPPTWGEYELIDTGGGKKIERFGSYTLTRPDTQALWSPALSEKIWNTADAAFHQQDSDGKAEGWQSYRAMPDKWLLRYRNLSFWARLTPFRHTGLFPEHGSHWDWLSRQIASSNKQPEVLVLFGYTGAMTLIAAAAGASVCHVDASRPALRWARENQHSSNLDHSPVRWIVDDVPKFVNRELRRGSRYDIIVMDPPVFGRGPKGQIWRLQESLQPLVETCTHLLSERASGMIINAYATTLSSITLWNVVREATRPRAGNVVAGELVVFDRSHRPLPTALYALWSQA